MEELAKLLDAATPTLPNVPNEGCDKRRWTRSSHAFTLWGRTKWIWKQAAVAVMAKLLPIVLISKKNAENMKWYFKFSPNFWSAISKFHLLEEVLHVKVVGAVEVAASAMASMMWGWRGHGILVVFKTRNARSRSMTSYRARNDFWTTHFLGHFSKLILTKMASRSTNYLVFARFVTMNEKGNSHKKSLKKPSKRQIVYITKGYSTEFA